VGREIYYLLKLSLNIKNAGVINLIFNAKIKKEELGKIIMIIMWSLRRLLASRLEVI